MLSSHASSRSIQAPLIVPSAELLLALVYVDQGLLPLARTQLEQVKRSALSPREAAQYDLALAYTILADPEKCSLTWMKLSVSSSLRAKTPLSSGSRLSSTWLCGLGDAGIFRELVRSSRAMITPATSLPRQPISWLCSPSRRRMLRRLQRRASDLQRRYPEMASRASFQSVIRAVLLC